MPEHANVIEALAAIMAELPGIAKVPHPAPSGRGLTYAYRGIEEITAEAQGLFAKHGVVVIPRVQSRKVEDIVVNGNPWTDTYLEVSWGIYGSGGIDDYVEASTFGVGRDNSDKGTNKAMTQAFKYLLLDTLMISDSADDTDGTNIETGSRVTPLAADPQHTSYEEINGEQIPVVPPMETTRSGPPSDLPTDKQRNFAKALVNGVVGAGPQQEANTAEWFREHGLRWNGGWGNITKGDAKVILDLLAPKKS